LKIGSRLNSLRGFLTASTFFRNCFLMLFQGGDEFGQVPVTLDAAKASLGHNKRCCAPV